MFPGTPLLNIEVEIILSKAFIATYTAESRLVLIKNSVSFFFSHEYICIHRKRSKKK